MTFDEIKEISINKFSAIVKQKCKDSAYNYLMNRRGSKGIEIEYNRIQMSEYLLPNNELNIENQQKLFAARNKMLNIPSNLTTREKNHSKCICGEQENMEHIYVCEQFNSEKPAENYEYLFSGNMKQQVQIFRRFEYNLKNREKLAEEKISKTESDHVIVNDPLFSLLLECGNG